MDSVKHGGGGMLLTPDSFGERFPPKRGRGEFKSQANSPRNWAAVFMPFSEPRSILLKLCTGIQDDAAFFPKVHLTDAGCGWQPALWARGLHVCPEG